MPAVISKPSHLTQCTTARIWGRSTAGTGPGEELTVGTGLTLSGGTLSCTLDLSGYVPYTGATANLNMGAFGVTAASVTVPNSGGRTDAVLTRSSLRIGQESGNQYGYITSDLNLGVTLRWNNTASVTSGMGVGEQGIYPVSNGSMSCGESGFAWNALQLYSVSGASGVAIYPAAGNTAKFRNPANTADAPITCAALTASGPITIPSTSYFIGNVTNGYRFNNAADTTTLLTITNAGVLQPSGPISIPSTSYFIGNAIAGYRFNNAADTTTLLTITNAGVATFTSTSESTITVKHSSDPGILFNATGDVNNAWRVKQSAGSFYVQHYTNQNFSGGTLTNAFDINGSTKAASFRGDILMLKTSAQGYIYSYNTNEDKYIRMSQSNTGATISNTAGEITLAPANGFVDLYTSGTQASLRCYDAGGTTNLSAKHNGTDGVVSTSSGGLNLIPATGIVTTTTSESTELRLINTGDNVIQLDLNANRSSTGVAVGNVRGKWNGNVIGQIAFLTGTDTVGKDDGGIGLFVANGGVLSEALNLSQTGAATFSKSVLQSSEPTATPSGTTQTLILNEGNYQTVNLGSTSGDLTLTLTVPSSTAEGSLLIVQHAATARDITWAASSGSIIWLGTEPTWNADTLSSVRKVKWRFNGTNLYLESSSPTA